MMLNSMERDVSVIFRKAQHVVAPDVIQLAGLHGLDRQLVTAAGNHRVQAQNFTRLRDSDNQGLALARGGRELGASLAENKNSARTLSFDKNHRMFRENRGMFYLVERWTPGRDRRKNCGNADRNSDSFRRSSIRTHSLALL